MSDTTQEQELRWQTDAKAWRAIPGIAGFSILVVVTLFSLVMSILVATHSIRDISHSHVMNARWLMEDPSGARVWFGVFLFFGGILSLTTRSFLKLRSRGAALLLKEHVIYIDEENRRKLRDLAMFDEAWQVERNGYRFAVMTSRNLVAGNWNWRRVKVYIPLPQEGADKIAAAIIKAINKDKSTA